MMADHAEISALFDEVLAAFKSGDRDLAALVFTRFERRLEAHLALEDELLLPPLRRVDPDEAAALSADHEWIRAQLTELGIGVDLHLTRATWVAAFVEKLRAHARREDALLYRWADDPTVPIDRTVVMGRLPRAHQGELR
jgi:hypothetical protein